MCLDSFRDNWSERVRLNYSFYRLFFKYLEIGLQIVLMKNLDKSVLNATYLSYCDVLYHDGGSRVCRLSRVL